MTETTKRRIQIGVLISVPLLLLGWIVWTILGGLMSQIKDQNGAEKTLCVITDDKIQNTTIDYQAFRQSVVTEGGGSSGVTGHFDDFDNDYTKIKIGKMSGIYMCNAVLGSGKDVTWKVTSAVTSGNMRIVITDENNTILQDLPIDATAEATVFCESGKMYYVKFVAESAEFTSELWREISP